MFQHTQIIAMLTDQFLKSEKYKYKIQSRSLGERKCFKLIISCDIVIPFYFQLQQQQHISSAS